MTRHMKQQHRKELRERTLEAVQSLGFFSEEHVLHLEIGAPTMCVRRRRRDTGGKRHVYLRLSRGWLVNVYERGIGVIQAGEGPRLALVINANELDEPPWGDQPTYFARVFSLQGNMASEHSLYIAHFADRWHGAHSLERAFELAVRPWRQILLGETDIPF